MSEFSERMLLKFRDVLAHTERLPPAKLRAYQESLLIPLLAHARRNVPFYKDRLASVFRGDEVDLTRWQEVPILTRAEAQANTQVLIATALPPHAGAVASGESSGSTGRPVWHLRNELADHASRGTTDRALRWWDFDGEKTMATFIGRRRANSGQPEEATERGWRFGYFGLHHMLDNSADTDTKIAWLLARRPHYLTAYSFVLMALAEAAQARGVDLRFERLISVGTALSDDIRQTCKEVLGTRPIDQYGAVEAGLIACECPYCGHYHFNAETMLAEILDAEGKPCAPGQAGRVVLTAFYNYAMPFIRYEIGDFAVAGPARGKCPVKLPTLERIMGRYRNTFTLRNGRIIYPHVQMARFREFISFTQIQVVQTDYDELEVRYVPLDPAREADAAGLETCLQEAIDSSFRVRAVPVEEIPRSASGKFEDYLSLVPRRGA